MMKWSYDDPITGERLQALAQTTVLTASIRAFHTSLSRSGVREAVVFPGSHVELDPDPRAIDVLRGKSSIFVYSHLLESFVRGVLPRLDHPFVLISHNSDHGVDERFRSALDDPRVIHWFAQNALIKHPKLTPIPIGVANAQWPHGNIRALVDVAAGGTGGVATGVVATSGAASVRLREKPKDVVYVNFDVRTNPAVRGPLLEKLQRLPIVRLAPALPFADYLADMARCRWVISPPGNGVDCHRTWETLYLGVTPVVLRSEAGANLHDGLPIIQVPDLAALDVPSLEQAERSFAGLEPGLARLKMSYWRKRVAEELPKARAA